MGEKEYFVYAGRLDEYKGIKMLFEAWKRMENTTTKLIVCGAGPMEEWCKLFLKENPDCDIEMRGFLDNTETKKLIANAKALILPTQVYEGFPMTILEAYSMGTPVIGSDLGNVGQLVSDGVTGFCFKHNSVKSLINAVKKVIQNDEISKEVIERIFGQMYSSQSNIKQLEMIYSNVLAKDSNIVRE